MAAAAHAADPVISEFMAANTATLTDEDGDSSDWIEVYNPDSAPVNLGGWFLTDNAAELDKWAFPAVTLQGNGYLLVFASGKNRRNPLAPLHTNFRLNIGGEYLALVKPDGATIACDFGPEFPAQHADYSFGIGQRVAITPLVPPRAPLAAFVPPDDALGTAWTGGNEPFDDSAWIHGPGGAGYVTMVPGFLVHNYRANTGVGSLAIAEQVIATPGIQTRVSIQNTPVINFLGTGSEGHYPGDLVFPGAAPGADEDNFVILATAAVVIPSAGSWTFGVMSDDGFGLDLTNGADSYRIQYPDPRGPADTLGTFFIKTAGEYRLRLVMYEQGGGSMVELFAAQGNHSSWNTSFRLVGDTAAGGLAAQSEVAEADAPGAFRDLIGTDLEAAMLDAGTSVFVRIPFTAANPGAFENIFLRMKYEDGFAAYLNGVEVARRNAPETLSHASRATADRPSDAALVYEDINISAYLGLLRPGVNILAFHGLNDDAASPEFLLWGELAQILIESEAAGFFDTPTPGAPNTLSLVDFVRDTRFSVDRGFYSAPFDVEITTATPGAQIRYTLDGTPPTARKGFVYTGPLRIAKTTCLRAAAFKEGCIPTNVDTQTYLFVDDIVRQDYQATLNAGFSATWGGTPPDYGLDPDVIGHTGPDRYGGKYAATIKDDLRSLPTLSIVLPVDDLFGPNGIYTNATSRGVAYERAASVELIHPNGARGFQEDCGLRIQGGAFRNHGLTKKHSFRLLFKGIYGATKLRFPLFGPGAPDRFDTVTLRATANDGYQWDAVGGRGLYVRDPFVRQTVLDMRQVSSHDTFVHLYLNGIYWGLYNPCERVDHAFSATYYGGDKEHWDSITQHGVNHGSIAAWNVMLNLCLQGLATNTAYYRIQGRDPDGTRNYALPNYLDVENYIDYMIANLYGGNTDWPHNNWAAGRYQLDGEGFKFYVWDAEWVMGIGSDLNTNQVSVSNAVATPWSALRQNPEFRRITGDRLHRYFFNGGPLAVDPSNPAWDPARPERNRPAERFAKLCGLIDRAMVAESARWGDQHAATPYTRDEHWAPERYNLLRDYFPLRSAIVLQQFRSVGLYPNVDAPAFSRHGGAIESGFALLMSAPAGTIYYTLDGADPRASDGTVSPFALEYADAAKLQLIAEDAFCRVLVPANGDLGSAWTAVDFDDSAWRTGFMGVGFEVSSGFEPYLGLSLRAEMYNKTSTVYIRVPFQLDNPAEIAGLTLGMRYDDGFVAFLNGAMVASRNAPVPALWNSNATASHPDALAVQFEAIPLTDAARHLRPGANVLALHGMNMAPGSSDMLIQATLEAATTAGGGGVTLAETTFVRARARYNTQWSAINEAVFHVFRPLDTLKITEVMYHPADEEDIDGDAFEFIELKNIGAETLDLSGVAFTDGIAFTFPEGTVLAPGAFLVLVADYAAFQARYPEVDAVFGVYYGSLSNSGERIELSDPAGLPLIAFTYDDDPPWPVDADGLGASLVPVDPDAVGDPDSYTFWTSSAWLGGSPGADDPGGIPTGGWQRPGDINQDAKLDISDAVGLLRALFAGAPFSLPCDGEGIAGGGNLTLLDVNADQRVDLADAIHLLRFLFQHGPQPALGARCVRIEGCPNRCF